MAGCSRTEKVGTKIKGNYYVSSNSTNQMDSCRKVRADSTQGNCMS